MSQFVVMLLAISLSDSGHLVDRSLDGALVAFPHKISAKSLPNVLRVHPKVISGGTPSGDEGFAELKSMGVRTIISVDGTRPDVKRARRFGMRYIHLPHGYDGISRGRIQELAKAVSDCDGPIFIHCHHGQHRSPAAAGVACIASGLIEPIDAVKVLQLAGTSQRYTGLFRTVRETRPLGDDLISRLHVQFRETAPVPPLVETMVALDETYSNLARIAESGWKSPSRHPDLDPAHEALMLKEHFTELLRREGVNQRNQEFHKLLRHSSMLADNLEKNLSNRDASRVSDLSEVTALFKSLRRTCVKCHRQFRHTAKRTRTESGS